MWRWGINLDFYKKEVGGFSFWQHWQSNVNILSPLLYFILATKFCQETYRIGNRGQFEEKISFFLSLSEDSSWVLTTNSTGSSRDIFWLMMTVQPTEWMIHRVACHNHHNFKPLLWHFIKKKYVNPFALNFLFNGIVHKKNSFVKSDILGYDGVWCSSFWSEGSRNHLNWQNLVQNFVPWGLDSRRN